MKDKKARLLTRRTYCLVAGFMLPLTVSAVPGSYLDCTRPGEMARKVICQPEDPELEKAEGELDEQYYDLQRSLTEDQANWLQESQRNWLEGGAGCSDDRVRESAVECLTSAYRTRASELALGVIVNPIREKHLPYQSFLPNGTKVRFELKEQRSGDGSRKVDELWFHDGTQSQRLWTTESVAESGNEAGCTRNNSLSELSLIALGDDHLILELVSECSGSSYYSPRVFQYLAHDSSNAFVAQGDVIHGEYSYTKRWVAGENGPYLLFDGYYNKGPDFSLFHTKDRQRLYRFRFDGEPWEERLPKPQTWLDESDAVTLYTALYRDIVADHEIPGRDDAACTEQGINWTLANISLDHWLDVAQAARMRGVAQSQVPAILGKMLAGDRRLSLTEGQRELFHALDYFRRRIEATEGWEKALDAVYMRASTEGLDGYDYGKHGFPNFKIQCLAVDGSLFDEGKIHSSYWFNTFWVRRYGEGTYDLAKRVIRYALKGEERNYEEERRNDPSHPTIFNKDTAMLAVFRAYNKEKQGTLIPTDLTSSWDLKQAKVLASPLLAETYREDGKEKAVIVIQRQEVHDGEIIAVHGIPVTISAYVFTRNGDQWFFETGEKEVTKLGTFNRAPAYRRLLKLGDDKHGIIFTWGDGYGGYGHWTAEIIGISEKPVVSLGVFNMGKSNSGYCSDVAEEQDDREMDACWSYEGKLSFLRKEGEDYYTLKRTYEGTTLEYGEDGETVIGVIPMEDEEYFTARYGEAYESLGELYLDDGRLVPESQIFLSPPPE